MEKQQDLVLSLNEETFSALKKDFDTILNRTLGNMEMKGASDAVITLKLTVGLDERSITIGDDIQNYKKPTFKHEVSSVMQIKDKMTGQLGGEYAMVWDPDEKRFVLRRFDGNQTSIFDADYETVDEPVGRFIDMPSDDRALPAPEGDEDDDEMQESDEAPVSSFDWLSQFIGETLTITEAMGNYTARTKDNKVVLSSATGEENPFYCDAETLAPHVGHQVVCVGYGEEEIVNVSIECEDCSVVLVDIEKIGPYEDDDVEDYGYEDPGEE